MTRSGLYLGTQCPPNMEAYLDRLADREEDIDFDLIVSSTCPVPDWLTNSPKYMIHQYDIPEASGASIIQACAQAVHQYVDDQGPDEVRQITQPRWHGPGVLLGARAGDVRTCTRVSESNLIEYRESSGMDKIRDYIVNNLIGRAVFLSDKFYTPRHSPASVSWWSSATREVERLAPADRFNPDADPMDGLFSQVERRVFTVGRVSQKKGIDLVIEVADRLPDWEFVVVGPVTDQDLANKANELANVSLNGPLDYIEMPRAHAACDILLSTSRIEWGGISRAMMEAANVGRPVVALDSENAESVATVTVNPTVTAIESALQNVYSGSTKPTPNID